MNIERLTIIAEWLEAGAPHKDGIDGFDMTNWSAGENWGDGCGTACCIGGAADQWFVKGKKDADRVRYAEDIEELAAEGKSKAAKALGLEPAVAASLFFPEASGIFMNEIHANWAARCIRKLIATGDVDWRGTK